MARLNAARSRTWQLVEPLTDEQLATPMADFLSPPVWDLGHMANFEERWLVQFFLECPELHEGFNDIYNAFKHSRKDRPKLRLLDRAGVERYMHEVRQRTSQVLEQLTLDHCEAKYLEDWYIHHMLALHEDQHQETLLQTIQYHANQKYVPAETQVGPAPVNPIEKGWIMVDEGSFQMGYDLRAGVYDNEAPTHAVDVDAFRMARYPVSNGEYLAFIEDGGYEDNSWWSKRGKQWLAESSHHAPLHWRQSSNGEWLRLLVTGNNNVTDQEVQDEVVCHISYFEAEAYAAWIGARLPSEVEWEKAARWSPSSGIIGRNPWGNEPADSSRCTIDQFNWRPGRVGSRPDSASPLGVEQLIGDVWEWTSSKFEAYPGYQAFPYDEYSKVFFGGDFRVLRGGSWATRSGCANATFRNWDHPYRKQIFAGMRLAMDV